MSLRSEAEVHQTVSLLCMAYRKFGQPQTASIIRVLLWVLREDSEFEEIMRQTAVMLDDGEEDLEVVKRNKLRMEQVIQKILSGEIS